MKSQPRTIQVLIAGLLLIFTLACNLGVVAQPPTAAPSPSLPSPTPIPPSPTAPFYLSSQLTVTSVPFNETNPGGAFPTYTINVQTPQLSGSPDTRVSALNQFITNVVDQEVDAYRKSFQELPVTPLSNGSTLDVTYALVSQMGDLWSFKFDFSFYADTAAHPGLNSLTVTYDLGQARPLALDDLFLPGYLEFISSYCIAELSKQPFFAEPFSVGATPTAENYRNWNLASSGLQITFDAYQVAPGAAGPQTVIVPWDQLSAYLNPQGPLAGLMP